jgi:hypothetical protein
MRFGSRSHDFVDPEELGAKLSAERDRLVKMLRDVADRLERLPANKANEVLVWVRGAVEPLLGMLRRVLGPES